MLARFPVSWIENGAINTITKNPLPVIVSCIRRDDYFQKTMDMLETLAEYFDNELDVYYALEDMFPYFSRKYNVSGTPTHVILYQGNALGTILGKRTIRELIEQTSGILLQHSMKKIHEIQKVSPKKRDQRMEATGKCIPVKIEQR